MNIQLKKGVMEIIVLSMLRRRDFYGYELVSEISRYIEMSEGTIYPLLNRFKKDGLVDTYLAESHNGPPRKYYKITEAGRTEYIESVREWSDFTKADEKKNPAPDNTSKEKSKEKQMQKKDSMKKTPENNKKDMPDTQSKVPPVEGNIPPAVQK